MDNYRAERGSRLAIVRNDSLAHQPVMLICTGSDEETGEFVMWSTRDEIAARTWARDYVRGT